MVSIGGEALRIYWCGANKISICGEANIDKKMREKLFLS